MRSPAIHHVNTLVSSVGNVTVKFQVKDLKGNIVGEKWIPARPMGFPSWRYRLRAAWLVFSGKADALLWEGQ